MTKRNTVLSLLLTLVSATAMIAQGTRMLRHPTVSHDLVAFEYASDIWTVSRGGGEARRLTATPGVEYDPYFSPDGSKIAFSSTVAGNTDVYVVATAGGDAKRLTYHPVSVSRRRHTTGSGRLTLTGGWPSPCRCHADTQEHIRLTAPGWHSRRS